MGKRSKPEATTHKEEEKDHGEGCIGPAVREALLKYLKKDAKLRKTAKYFKKETESAIQSRPLDKPVDFELKPLFDRIETAFHEESSRNKKRKVGGAADASKPSASEKERERGHSKHSSSKHRKVEAQEPLEDSSSRGDNEQGNKGERNPGGDADPSPTHLTKKERKARQKEMQSSGPLQRLDESHWKSKAVIQDNSFFAKGGDEYAQKAAVELIRVKGKDFRQEKAKKKRATWRGTGAIDLGVNSFIFEDSD